MILVDMNQISVASVMMHLHMTKQTKPDEDMVRHMILNSLRMYRMKFCDEYGELVLCYDSKHYWRRDYYPEYKNNRKKTRDSSSNDWDAIFGVLNAIKAELKEFFPYKHLEVYGAEADDIIAAIAGELEFNSGKTLILSGDKDFIQLQKFRNVTQYSPITKKFINGQDPHDYLDEHILKGDTSDGIPNVLSDDDVFVEGRRQRPLTKKKIASWVDEMVMTFTEEEQKNYDRNRKLIDLSLIPPELEAKIYNEFDEVKVAHRSKILNYFITRKLKTLIEVIDEF